MVKLKVCCALIIVEIANSEPLLLLAKKPRGSSHAGLYEFPGGKIEKYEQAHEAIIREINEELACNIEITASLTPVCIESENRLIELIPFICKLKHNSMFPVPLEHESIGLFTFTTAGKLDLSPPDIPIFKELITIYR